MKHNKQRVQTSEHWTIIVKLATTKWLTDEDCYSFYILDRYHSCSELQCVATFEANVAKSISTCLLPRAQPRVVKPQRSWVSEMLRGVRALCIPNASNPSFIS